MYDPKDGVHINGFVSTVHQVRLKPRQRRKRLSSGFRGSILSLQLQPAFAFGSVRNCAAVACGPHHFALTARSVSGIQIPQHAACWPDPSRNDQLPILRCEDPHSEWVDLPKRLQEIYFYRDCHIYNYSFALHPEDLSPSGLCAPSPGSITWTCSSFFRTVSRRKLRPCSYSPDRGTSFASEMGSAVLPTQIKLPSCSHRQL